MMRRTPLARTGFKRKPGGALSSFKRSKPFTSSSSIKKKARRPKKGDDKRMRDACRDEPCYLRFLGICPCRFPEETIVPAHRNEGKGGGMKNPDRFTLPACYWCHYEYDQGKRFDRPFKRAAYDAGFEKWVPARAAKLGLQVD